MRDWCGTAQLPLARSQPVGNGVGVPGERDKICSILVTKHPDGGAGRSISGGTGGRCRGSGGGELAQPVISISSSALTAQAVLGEDIGVPCRAACFLGLQHARAALGRQLVLQRVPRRFPDRHTPSSGECRQQGQQRCQDAGRQAHAG
ncbi:MAG: hypothetical protein EBR82_09645 [Caulobacteraceae bacterium]|nr:hypothetical protein [Caulobacteraceae bacterium]